MCTGALLSGDECYYNSDEPANDCYVVRDTSNTWQSAKIQCEGIGGSMAQIESEGTMELVKQVTIVLKHIFPQPRLPACSMHK